MSLLWSLYRAATPIAGVLAPAAGMFAGPERPLWSERLGHLGSAPGPVDAWIHSASLGEAVAAQALHDALRAERPTARCFFTATTRTGRERLGKLGAPAALAPLDTPQAAAAFLGALRPPRLFLIETELWPEWLTRARRNQVVVAVVSARLSARTAERYAWLGAPLRDLLQGLTAVLCQTEDDRARWLALGARPERTVVTGNLKFDALPAPASDRGVARAALGLDRRRPLLVLASLRPGEGQRLATAWNALAPETRARWQVVAVPRHPHASRAIRTEAEGAGAMIVTGGSPEPGAWRWDDRPGVLAEYYAAADVAFVGGSLVPLGGHNPLEPAAAGAATLIGPHHESQRPAMELLAAAQAVLVTREETLAGTLRSVLDNEAERTRLAEAGLRVAANARGAAQRAVARLVEWGAWSAA
jgi:3-deoxy-D-manno-octulosonic-acid transferase